LLALLCVAQWWQLAAFGLMNNLNTTDEMDVEGKIEGQHQRKSFNDVKRELVEVLNIFFLKIAQFQAIDTSLVVTPKIKYFLIYFEHSHKRQQCRMRERVVNFNNVCTTKLCLPASVRVNR
jgi:hypothetical protein